MTEKTLQQSYGINASQDGTALIIAKADLVAYGLVPALENKAEQLIGALFKLWRETYTDASYEISPEQSIKISLATKNFTTRSDGSPVISWAYTIEVIEPDELSEYNVLKL